MSRNGKGVVFGANGTAQVAFGASGSDVQTRLLELFYKLIRSADLDTLREDVDAIVAQARAEAGVAAAAAAAAAGGEGAADSVAEGVVDLFVLAFQTRDCRGGKGERRLFHAMFLRMFEHFPEQCLKVLPLVTEYGSFKDYTQLYQMAVQEQDDPAKFAALSCAVVDAFAAALRKDQDAVDAAVREKVEPKGLSLAAKYAPRIVSASRAAATDAKRTKVCLGRAIRDVLFADPETGAVPAKASELYRKMVSGLNKRLRTMEVLMSAHRWDEIQPGSIPSVCLKKQTKAFLFETKNGAIRDPANEARVALRERCLNPKNANKIKGGQLFAHDIVSKCMTTSPSTGEAAILDAQWNDIVRTVQKQVEEFAAQQDDPEVEGAEDEAAATPAAPGIDLGNLIPLVDVSASMSGTPMQVAIAMGLIVSQITAPAYRGRVLTFESTPRWHRIADGGIFQKVRDLMRAPWGGSTNFRLAMQRVIEAVEAVAERDGALPKLPELIVFSDMQFDQAGAARWDTAHDTIRRDFVAMQERLRSVGVDVGSEPIEPPTITFWNIRSSTTGLVTDADTPGVRLLSGFSQSLLKLVLAGKIPDAPPTNAKEPAKKIDPLETLRAALDDDRYDLVRETLLGIAAAEAEADGAPELPAPGNGGGGAK